MECGITVCIDNNIDNDNNIDIDNSNQCGFVCTGPKCSVGKDNNDVAVFCKNCIWPNSQTCSSCGKFECFECLQIGEYEKVCSECYM